MKLKKLNAALGLLTIVLALVHVGWSVFAYLTFRYDPVMKDLTAYPFMALTCVHAVLGMCAVFFQSDGTRLDLYPKFNRRTALQRVSAALIFPLLLVHTRTFSLMMGLSGAWQWPLFALLLLAQLLFYAVVLTHVATSLSRALITLGLLSDEKRLRALDRAVWILCGAVFAAAAVCVTRTQLIMFLSRGGAA